MGSFVSSALCPHPSFFIDPFSALLCYHCGSRARLRCRSRALRLGRREVSCTQRAEVGLLSLQAQWGAWQAQLQEHGLPGEPMQ